jgi:hypothetical protein
MNIYNSINTGLYEPGNFPGGDIIWNNTGATADGTFNISPTPEPAEWVMMLLGIGIIAGVRWMARRRKEMTPSAA